MSDVVISVENLGKRYVIGAREDRADSIRDGIMRKWRGFGDALRRDAPDDGTDTTLWALRNVSFEVRRGDIVGVIGRNGAGKSTLLKILSRITRPTEGGAEIRGRVGSLLEVGTGFHPELTGRENVFLNGALLGMKRSEIAARFDAIVAFAEVERFIDTPVKRYSSGMYLRLAFAVAAHLEPQILLVDEVLAVGDMQFQRRCLGKLQEVAQSGRTVLFVSHNISAVCALCSSALLLANGGLASVGPPGRLAAEYMRSLWNVDDLAARGGLRPLDPESPVRLLSVECHTADGERAENVAINSPLSVSVHLWVDRPGVPFRTGVSFRHQGDAAFTSVEPTEVAAETSGDLCISVQVPENLFAEGEYSMGLSLFSSRGVKKHYYQVPDAAFFHVFDPMTGTSARGDYSERLTGVVRPLLTWTRDVTARPRSAGDSAPLGRPSGMDA
jgi:lipopolysaccharide transport system ATP-binding protein